MRWLSYFGKVFAISQVLKPIIMKNLLCAFALLVFSSNDLSSQPIDLFLPFNMTGSPTDMWAGTIVFNITVQAQDVVISSMTFNNFDVGPGNTATVAARIYSFNPQATPNASLLLAQTITTTNVHNGPVTVPAIFTLKAGKSYRLGFYTYTPNADHTFKVAMPSIVPYFDSNQLIRVDFGGSYTDQNDICPVGGTNDLPYFSLGMNTTRVLSNLSVITKEIYPNPANDHAVISLGKIYSQVKIELFNSLGKIAYTQEFNNTSNPSINTSDLCKGLYYVRIKNEEGTESSTIKFVKE
jgi:hypothetical protein